MSLELSPMEIKILACVNDSNTPVSITDIRKKVDCSTNYSMQAVQRLVKAGFLQSEKRGRKKIISVRNQNLTQACSTIAKAKTLSCLI